MSAVTAFESDTAKLGLLLETSQSQQELVSAELERLQAHTRGLDEIVRAQIRRTLLEELAGLGAESERAVNALRSVGRMARQRFVAAGLLMAVVWVLGAVLTVRCLVPSTAQVAALRAERDREAAALALLGQQGGRIDLRRCGSESRWCVRIDRHAPAYGDTADYLVVKGY
jgi:hypothetical protein